MANIFTILDFRLQYDFRKNIFLILYRSHMQVGSPTLSTNVGPSLLVTVHKAGVDVV